MKPQYYIIAVILLIFSFPQTSTSQNIQEQIVGTWTFDYEASLSNMDEASKAHYARIGAERQNRISGAYKGRKITFNADGSYTQVFSNGKSSTITWAIKGNKDLEITTSDGRSIPFKIEELGTNKLILSPVNTKGNKASVLFSYWYLTKN